MLYSEIAGRQLVFLGWPNIPTLFQGCWSCTQPGNPRAGPQVTCGGMASAPGPVLSSPLGPPSPLSCQHPCSLPAACPAFSPRVGLAHPLRVALGTGRSGGHTLMLEATRATRVVCTPRTTPACIESPGLRPHLIGRCLPKAKRWDWGGAKQAVLGWVQKTSSLYKLIVTI